MKLDAAQRRLLLGDAAGWIASGFGTGLSPWAPGTVGSAAALLPWLALREAPAFAYLGVVALAFVLGVWACGRAAARLRLDDPGALVWDEFVGQWIACLPLVAGPRAPIWVLAAFLLFRAFDIAKPWPVSWADRRFDGGFGVMFDDVLAGLYAAAVLALLHRLM